MIIFLSIIVVITIILCLSVVVYVDIKENVTIKIGTLGIKYTVYPTNKEPKTKKTNKSKKVKDKSIEEKLGKKVRKHSFGEIIEMILAGISAVLKPTGKLMSKIRLTNVNIKISVCGDEADKTAIKFGEITTAIYSVLGYLNQLIKVKIKCIDIRPDFVDDEDKYDMTFRIKLRIYQILGSGIRILVSFFVNILKKKANQN